jgi:hypothetical protein
LMSCSPFSTAALSGDKPKETSRRTAIPPRSRHFCLGLLWGSACWPAPSPIGNCSRELQSQRGFARLRIRRS